MNSFYQNKVAVITGASSGIGKAIAIDLAQRGVKVVLGARRESKLIEVVNTIKNQGGAAIYCVTDVTQEHLCQKLINTAIDQYGTLDILVCNAGISMRANFNDVDITVLHRLMNVNFWGAVYCTKYALPWLIKSKEVWSAFHPLRVFTVCRAEQVIRHLNLLYQDSWKPYG